MLPKMLLIISLFSFERVGAKPRCGGIYTAARGTIQTPGFPGPFPTPIHCEWVIDAQHLLSKNTSIIVYLTQLFVFEGLKFTEYQVYDESFHFNGRDLLVVNETNVISVKTVETRQSYLVISLKLASIDSTHLRVLDHFLNVFGFNATYEIREGNARTDACNMMDCGFNGICQDYFTKFGCSCFSNFTGSHCSEGPNSLCGTIEGMTCHNGGTCRHVGAATVKCLCLEGFTGKGCETSIISGQLEGEQNDDYAVSCPFSGKEEDACNCSQTKDHTGYFVRMHLGNLPKLENVELQEFIRNQVSKSLTAEIPSLQNVIIETVELNMAGADVTIRIYSNKKDGEALKSVFTRWSARRFISNLTVLDEDINFGPISSSMSLSVNKPGTIRVHEEFVLSCAARGSSSMTFRWMKDGVIINTSHSWGRKWNRIIKDPHVDGQYTALLGVADADALDEGVFTCQVEDFRFQRCVSKRIRIKRPPVIKLDPMSLTVHKGENFTIKCICSEEDPFSKYTYSWTKNRELLPVRTEWGSYEILYPGGSILQVHKAEKSASYSCLVQDGAISAEATVEVIVVTTEGIRTCNAEENHNVRWPETAPDANSHQRCPKGYFGVAFRQCSFSAHGPSWRMPDFSQCTSKELADVFDKFNLYRLGYETSVGPTKTLAAVLRRLGGRRLLPGEGARVLTLVRSVISTTNGSRFQPADSGRVLFDIVDGIMGQREALIGEMQVKLLQQLIKEMVLLYFSHQVNGTQSVFHQSSPTIDVSLAQVDKMKSPFLRIPLPRKSYPKWFSYKLEVNVEHAALGDSPPVLVSVVYRNLSSFLPQRSAIRLNDGAEMEYVLLSEMAATWFSDMANKAEFLPLNGATVSMEFRHRAPNVTLHNWETRCAVSDFAMFDNSWNILACNTEKLNETSTRCFCTRTGTFAVILTNKSQKSFSDKLEIHKFIATLGCSICFILSTASGIVLLVHWSHNRTCLLFVKLQCCFSISGAMMVFIVALATSDNNHSASFAMCMMVFLETFLLIAASTQLSKLLVVYAEFVQFPKPSSAKLTVIGIITGVPLITVFGNHMAHRTMNVKLKTWWIVTGSLSFYVFMTCFVIIILLYIFIYFVVECKIHQFLRYHQKNLGCIQQRINLLHRSALIFVFLITTTLSSIACVNYTSEIFWHYEFCVISISLGLVIVVSYVIKKDDILYPDVLDKIKNDSNNIIIANSTNKHLTFYTKEDAEAESESTPESKFMPRTTKVRFAIEPQIDLIEHAPEVVATDVLENYKCSPKSFRRNYPLSDVVQRTSQEMECLELDLVISLKQEEPKNVNFVTPMIAVASTNDLVLDNGKKMEFSTFHKNSVSHSKPASDVEMCEKKTTEPTRDLDVLTSISQDLDYLLNQEEDLRDTLKRKRLKSPRRSRQEVVEDVKYPEVVTEISRTHC